MKEESGNIVSSNEKILLFSKHNFVNQICNEETCFICGIKKNDTDFNDEHVIPRWILKRYQLFEKKISLANGKQIKYGNYKIPCCKKCNSFLGEEIENKIAEGFGKNIEDSIKFFNKNRKLVFTWISLLYIKTHLKDKAFKFDFLSNRKISDDYNWDELHHIHCIARSIYTNIFIEESVYGSMFIFPCSDFIDGEKYDYIDLYGTGTVLLRLGDFFIICVINDSKLVTKLMENKTKRITGKLNFLQIRELYSRITYEFLRIIDRPKYYTAVKFKDNYIGIQTLINNTIRIAPYDEEFFGSLMYTLVKDYMYKPEHPILKNKMQEQIQAIKKGQWTYLFDSNGKFIEDFPNIIEHEDIVAENLKMGIDIFIK
ncbi:hypothetical protein AB0W31_07510 [Aliarcobacter butzleri]|uniref:HNH endonuclease n=1 Tax=Aliarcobacter butzleri TaxID=28197 RepID=A0AAW7Q4S6_9BACT|nr:hypothetical protein [Aliarcobacter butzleri]MDN5114174.1 hypothetical protein [Aliarcobacter butzleri]